MTESWANVYVFSPSHNHLFLKIIFSIFQIPHRKVFNEWIYECMNERAFNINTKLDLLTGQQIVKLKLFEFFETNAYRENTCLVSMNYGTILICIVLSPGGLLCIPVQEEALLGVLHSNIIRYWHVSDLLLQAISLQSIQQNA